jgi:secondary thiamine-phosphate synthase enzyme
MAVQAESEITIETRGRGLYEFTDGVTAWVSAQARGTGLLTLFLRHTSASLLIQENADPDVLADLETFFAGLVPDDPALYRHTTEGPDDMPAHIRAALTQTQLTIPVSGGAPVLGTWQGIFLYEHRTAPHVRKVAFHLITG